MEEEDGAATEDGEIMEDGEAIMEDGATAAGVEDGANETIPIDFHFMYIFTGIQ